MLESFDRFTTILPRTRRQHRHHFYTLHIVRLTFEKIVGTPFTKTISEDLPLDLVAVNLRLVDTHSPTHVRPLAEHYLLEVDSACN